MKRYMLFVLALMVCSCSIKTYNVASIREENLDVDYYGGAEYLCSVIGATEVDVNLSVDKKNRNLNIVLNAINNSGEKIDLFPENISYYFTDAGADVHREIVPYSADEYVKYLEKMAANKRFWGFLFFGADAYADATSEKTTFSFVTDSSGNTSYSQNTVRETDPAMLRILFAMYCNRVNNDYLDDLNNIEDISAMLLRKHTLRPGTSVAGLVVMKLKDLDIRDGVMTLLVPLEDTVHEFSYRIKKEKQ